MKQKAAILFFLHFAVACTDPSRLAGIKEEMLKEHIAAFKKEHKMRCREEALEKANAIADSIMLEFAVYQKIDTFIKPPRPIKPEFREIKIKGNVEKAAD